MENLCSEKGSKFVKELKERTIKILKHLQKEFKYNLMKELMKKIKQDMDDKGFKIRPLAKKVGVDRSVITDGIVTGKTAEMKLDTFMKIMDVVYENLEERQEVIRKFIKLSRNDLNIRKSLVYCQGTGEYDVIADLVKIHQGDRLLNKYIRVYELFNKRNQNIKRTTINRRDG